MCYWQCNDDDDDDAAAADDDDADDDDVLQHLYHAFEHCVD